MKNTFRGAWRRKNVEPQATQINDNRSGTGQMKKSTLYSMEHWCERDWTLSGTDACNLIELFYLYFTDMWCWVTAGRGRDSNYSFRNCHWMIFAQAGHRMVDWIPYIWIYYIFTIIPYRTVESIQSAPSLTHTSHCSPESNGSFNVAR